MIYLLTAVDSTTTLGSKGMTDAIISRMESEIQVITFQITGNASRLLKWLWEITILSGHPNYTNNPLPMGIKTANISAIWKAAPFWADCTNELHKHTASNRDTVERYSGIKPGVRSSFPSFSHCSFIKHSQSLTDHHSWFSCVSAFRLVHQMFIKYLLSAKHRTTCWRYKDEQDAFPERMEVKSINELRSLREAVLTLLCPLYCFWDSPLVKSLLFRSTLHHYPHLTIPA